MTSDQLKKILRSAVFASLPAIAALQMGCDPCYGPTQRTPTETTISDKLPSTDAIPLSMDECIRRCRTLIDQQRAQGNPFGGYGSIEDFTTSVCETKLDDQGNGQIDCKANYDVVVTPLTGAAGCPVPGRLPTGTQIHAQENTHELGQYFAQMAAMETAAVTAFRYLVRELEAYQAPASLIESAQQAIEEEIQHAHLAGLLAQAYGAETPVLEIEPFRLRPLAEIALENATEGCVNETFAAACGMWQQEHAELDAFRAVVGRIVEEESRHAALSWAIHAWAHPQLTSEEQAHCRQAQKAAVEALEQNFLEEAPPHVRLAVGLPNHDDAAQIFKQLREQLWAPRIEA
ncbi:MAG: ferritin-like domain-containing protein [Myxococcales bacterium]|nr:ferritin-like domain-containing protein [Myxococcales bacterium]MCB9642865.1 ferritin-like domain-containing protein [Myxococcales bacterium]